MPISITDFLSSVVLPAFVASGAAYLVVMALGKRLVDHRLSKDIERYRTELGQRTEALKTELGIYAHEQNIALSRIDAQRADAVNRVYARLVAWTKPVSHLVAGSPYHNVPDDTHFYYYKDHGEKAHAAGKELADELLANAIYFDPEVYRRVSETVTSSIEVIAKFLSPIRQAEAEDLDFYVLNEHAEGQRQELVVLYRDKIQPLHQQLIDEFRRVLGATRPRTVP